MQKYYIIDWPDSQEYFDNKKCYNIQDTLMVAVPVEIMDKK